MIACLITDFVEPISGKLRNIPNYRLPEKKAVIFGKTMGRTYPSVPSGHLRRRSCCVCFRQKSVDVLFLISLIFSGVYGTCNNGVRLSGSGCWGKCVSDGNEVFVSCQWSYRGHFLDGGVFPFVQWHGESSRQKLIIE